MEIQAGFLTDGVLLSAPNVHAVVRRGLHSTRTAVPVRPLMRRVWRSWISVTVMPWPSN